MRKLGELNMFPLWGWIVGLFPLWVIGGLGEVRADAGKVYGVPQQIVWSEDGTAFFYRTDQPGDRTAYYLVDAIGHRKTPIDIAAAERQMAGLSPSNGKPDALPGREVNVLSASAITFVHGKSVWQWNNLEKKLAKVGDAPQGSDRRGGYWGSRRDDSKGGPAVSPDGTLTAYIKNSNVHVAKKNDPKSERQLTFDGSPGEYYAATLQWSGDSRKLAVAKVRRTETRQLTLLESSPKDQLQPKLHTRDYVKPGDALPQYYPAIIHVADGRMLAVEPGRVPNQFSLSHIAWTEDGSAITFEYNQRGHQRYAVFRLDAAIGELKTLIRETSRTFIDYSGKKFRKDLPKTREIVWMSERDGWNHLYLFDAESGKLKNRITKGEWVVRNVLHVDGENRRILFEASGMKPGEDPYFVRCYAIGFDGRGLRELTPEPANHQSHFNRQHSLFVDVFSRVDQAPRAVLRSAADGSQLMELERADISELLATGWKAPEPFTAKGRDGKTDIWGIIIRPKNFDPANKYPVIEYIYAGPHGSFVPKSFSANPSGMHELAELGFILVQVDGMGTSNRSKAFQDVAWKNLKDAGFPDRIAWIKAAAQRYPYMDLERVGIYGTSAGGQSSTGALLFHPEFYKVAVSSCGCHDNRMDKIWWNEQWMGWPIGPQYAACSNVENAHRLQGKLMLILGEMDDNVDPASTYQLLDALIRNGKDHEFVLVPGMGHSSGGDFGEKKRRDFFVKHLQGAARN